MPWQVQTYMQFVYLSTIPVVQVFLKGQNEQEVQSELVGC